jgi:hypothetical protein
LALATGLLASASLFGCNPNDATAPPALRPQTCDCQPRPVAPAPTVETQTPERYAEEPRRAAYRHPSHYAMRAAYRESGEGYAEHPGYSAEEVSTYNYVSPSSSYRIGEDTYRSAGYESESQEGYGGNAYDGDEADRGGDYDAYESRQDYRAHNAPMSINSPRALDSWSGYSDSGIYDNSGGDLAESVISTAGEVVEAGAESGLIDLGIDVLAARWGHGHGRHWWGHRDRDDHRWGHRWGDHDHDWDDRHHWGDHDHDWDDRHRWGDHDHDWDDHRHRWGDHDHDWDDRHRWGDHDHDWDDRHRWGDHDHDWDDRRGGWGRSHTSMPRSHRSW